LCIVVIGFGVPKKSWHFVVSLPPEFWLKGPPLLKKIKLGDTFSYKILFHPTSYAKVIAVLPGHKVFCKNIKIQVYYFF
jgi:hypothetical protein